MVSRGREVVGLEVSRQKRMWCQEVLHSQAVTWWKRLAVLAFHAGARPCIFGVIGETNCGGTVSDVNSDVLSCRSGCHGEKAVAETFNKINISEAKYRSLSFISGEVTISGSFEC